MSLNSPFNINDLMLMRSLSYLTVEKVMLIELSSSEESFQLLSQSKNWFGEEDFQVSPQIFFQIYTVDAQINGHILDCINALLPKESEETYTLLFTEVEQHVENSPTDIFIDFERDALNSVCQVYPNTEHKGCFCHFSSNIQKDIQNLGLQNHYQDNENFALWLRMPSALALVPLNDAIRHFELLIDEIRNFSNSNCQVLFHSKDMIEIFENSRYPKRFGCIIIN